MRRLTTLGVSLAIVLAGILAAGCGPSEADRLRLFLNERPKPIREGVPYRVLPPDVITIRSTYVPEIDGETQQIRPDGYINLPLVGEIDVVGKTRMGLTPDEIEKAIEAKAKDYYEQTQTTVQVTGYNSQKIFVFGQVGRAGPQPWTGGNTVLDVLSNSQPTTLAWPERIVLVRCKNPTRGGYQFNTNDLEKAAEKAPEVGEDIASAPTVQGTPAEAAPEGATKVEAAPAEIDPNSKDLASKPAEPKQQEAWVLRINLKKMYEKGDLSKNVYLQPDDIIYVPPNPLAKIGLAIQQLLFPVRPALETVTLPSSAMYSVNRPY